MATPEEPADMREQTTPEQVANMREQATKFSTIPEAALAKPRLDMAAMREQIIANAVALIYMSHVHSNSQGNIRGINPPPQIITIREGSHVHAEVVGMVICNVTLRFHMRTEIRGSRYKTDAEALVSLYEESRRGITNAKRILNAMGLFQVA